jgi:hypothetical protein
MVEYDRQALERLFPGWDWDSLTVVRCTRETAGEGRWVKSHGDLEHRTYVRIVCKPAFTLSVRLEHIWSPELPLETRRQLDWGILEGVMEGLVAGEYPAWLCSVSITDVGPVAPDSSVAAVRVAAQLAVESALRSATWKLQTRPPGALPHGEEPA